MSDKIKVTMTETVTYVAEYTREEIEGHFPDLDLSDMSESEIVGLIRGDLAGQDTATVDSAQDALDGTLLDDVLNNYDRCEDRSWTAEVKPDLGQCEWFALCAHPATTTQSHPVLGDVPICADHKKWVNS